jgi:hypothetical protein
MKHPVYYRGVKRRIGFFLLQHSLLTTRQWREVLLSEPDTTKTHEEFAKAYPMMEPERHMTRQQLEEQITRPPTWREYLPTSRPYWAAFALATVGEIGGPESSLGPTREAALQLLRRRLTPLDMATIEVALAEYDRTGPHPPHVFGTGWTEGDAQRAQLAADERAREEGHRGYTEWLAHRRAHVRLRLIDGLLYLKRFAFALSPPRRYRELRYRV